jgi:site-specific DNA-cytosine methylase
MDVITEALGVEPIFINSSLVSAQNRQRYYWTNIPLDGVPEDKGIMLRDILEEGIVDRDKAHCIDANYFKGGNLKSYFEKHRRQLVFDFDLKKSGLVQVGETEEYQHYNNSQIKRVYHPDGKAPTLLVNQGGNREPKVATHDPKGGRIVNRRLDENGTRKDYDKSIPLQPRVEVREDDKTNCLSTVYKDSVVVEDMTWRKLTPLECERLQTVPDGYTAHVSNTQRYKMLGNGWTVDVIKHIMKGMEL